MHRCGCGRSGDKADQAPGVLSHLPGSFLGAISGTN